ncbi:MAG: valine--tRNA ligase [Leptolyngbya sp. PLA3]|nr:MAG: valine--tRNA ligase [Cyanobacteria bacterium CYA]MCE7969026.1 valine--tRNA ligase [Leptolyngbya sp. PL-A3]
MPSEGLSKAYRPEEHEGRIWQRWIDADAFHADPHRVLAGEAEPYCILIPPPNVTAALHLGHALNNTLQDVLARAHRMMGFETLWMPGTDHAGIATQTVVDKRLQAAGEPSIAQLRQVDGGRERFIEKVQAFKDEYEARITDQLKAMGCSCDWKRQRFTMDPVCARAVREAFFRLFRAGLIERGKRLVNWDPVSQTALADDEVEMKEVDGAFYYMRYPLVHPSQNANDPKDAQEVTWSELAAKGYPGAHEMPEDEPAWVTVATTRPETYLGDTAVAVNPKDPRARALAGLKVQLPIVGRIIPIIEDEYVVLPLRYPWETEEQADMRRDEAEPIDPKALMATGFLKVTPAHDPNDWEIGRRHRLDVINVMAPDASISDAHGWNAASRGEEGHIFFGKSREEARELVVKEFKARQLLEQVKPHRHSVGHSYRSHAMIEPYLSDQWYVKVTDDRLRGEAQRALRVEQRSEESLRAWPESRPEEEQQSSKAAKQQIRNKTSESGSSGLPSADLPCAGLRSGDACMSFYPSRYAKTYEMWHDNLRDWCISRQLWWGHRIPVWSAASNAEDTRATLDRMGLDWPKDNELIFEQADDRGNVYMVTRVVFDANSRESRSFCCIAPGRAEIEAEVERLGFEQDPDVLDTWFSSALWPLSTLGWPDAKAAAADTGIADFDALLEAFNPTSVLCTAREIITLWVSRMVMFNRFFRGNIGGMGLSPVADGAGDAHGPDARATAGPVPFKDVFIHAMIQDGEGRKMSKSLGNGVDPLDIIHTHGADAMRFTLVQMTTQTQDVRMPVERDEKTGRNTSPKFDIGRNFCNKLWNAARFALSNLPADPPPRGQGPAMVEAAAIDPASLPLADRWMLSRLAEATEQATSAIAGYQFNVYAQSMYDLLWRDFCDWYLEAIKPTVKTNPAQQACLRAVLDAILRLLHPIAPFISEAIHEKVSEVSLPPITGLGLAPARKSVLATAGWPRVDAHLRDLAAVEQFERMRTLVNSIREVRAQHQVQPKRIVTLHADAALLTQIGTVCGLVETLAGVAMSDGSPDGASAAFAFEQREYRLSNLADAIDTRAERDRLSRELDALDKSIFALEKRLQNPGYTEKAPAHLVQQTRDELTQKQRDREALVAALETVH